MFDVGQYGVQTFFVISGFVIPWSMYRAGFEFKNIFTFLLKRLARLEPPYLFSILLALTVLFAREKFLGRANDHIEISLTQVFLHVGYLIPFFEGQHWLNQVYWTLGIEFQYYFLIALLFIPLVKTNVFVRTIIYGAIIALSFTTTAYFLPFWMPVFLLGILLFLYKCEITQGIEYFLSSTLLIAFCLFKYPLASVIYAIIPLIVLLLIENKKIPGLNFIGKFSYSIYLIHPILGSSLINILSHKMTGDFQKVICICAGMLFTFITAWIHYYIIEKPSKKLSASITYQQPDRKVI
jgi:peptidoglycan/LPS O-acetylase OafA/YrhL